MHRGKLKIFVIIVIIVVGGLFTILYSRSNSAWQENYRQDVSEGIVNLLQTNPYDKAAVVVIVIDGLRYTEGIDAEDQFMPHIWNDLRPLGTLLTNFQIASPTATTSAHTAMLTGRVSTVPNDGHMRPVFPTFMEYYRDARMDYVESAIEEITGFEAGIFRPDADSLAEINGLVDSAMDFPPEATSLYIGKDLLYSLDQSSCGRYPDEDIFLFDRMRDIEVTDYFRAKIPDLKPNIVFVNLGDVDEAGHEVEWHYYVDSIRWADRHVFTMWEALQAESRYRDRTYFIVTTDHGRHIPERGGFAHHGCFCDGCRHSFMLLIGPGIKRNFVSDTLHYETDLAATLGKALGFSTPGSTGEPMMEIFEHPESLPEQRITSTTILVAEDRENVDVRDTVGILLDKLIDETPESVWGNNVETAMLTMAMANRMRNYPDKAGESGASISSLASACLNRNEQQGTDAVDGYEDLLLAYPFLVLSRETGPDQDSIFHTLPWYRLYRARQIRLIDFSNPQPEMKIEEIALIAPLAAAYGMEHDNEYATRWAYNILLNTLAQYQGREKVFTPGLNDFIDDYFYRDDDNEIFTEREISMRDNQWLLWGIERTLAESNPDHAPELYPLLRRQYRLLGAFCSIWQDANGMVGGNGELGEEIDFVAQGLSLAALADFGPWRKWELDELGYDMDVYRTPLFDWPLGHFFYIVGQANALAGAWSANERLMLFVNDDGSIRRDLTDTNPPILTSDPDYPIIAASLAFGLSRFEDAEYEMFDLESYPIVHQQE